MKDFLNIDFESLLRVWAVGIVNFIPTLIWAGFLYFAGRYVIRLIVKLIQNLMSRRQVDSTLQSFLLQVVRWILYIALFLTIVQIIGLPATQFIAIITSAFVAVGLALQGSLSNFASGIMILIFKPFRLGDVIEGNGQKGKVKSIGLFATTLNKDNNEEAIIPNTQLFSNSIVNYSREDQRRVYVKVGISYSSDIQRARQTLLQIAKEEPKALMSPEPVVYVEELADSSVNLSLRYWCQNADYADCYFGTIEAIKTRFDQAGIEIPFPQMQVSGVKG